MATALSVIFQSLTVLDCFLYDFYVPTVTMVEAIHIHVYMHMKNVNNVICGLSQTTVNSKVFCLVPWTLR